MTVVSSDAIRYANITLKNVPFGGALKEAGYHIESISNYNGQPFIVLSGASNGRNIALLLNNSFQMPVVEAIGLRWNNCGAPPMCGLRDLTQYKKPAIFAGQEELSPYCMYGNPREEIQIPVDTLEEVLSFLSGKKIARIGG